jgi:hypothetical protein
MWHRVMARQSANGASLVRIWAMIATALCLTLAAGLTACAPSPESPPLRLVECAGWAHVLANPGNPCDYPVPLGD